MEEQPRSLCDHQETAEAAQRCLVVRLKLYLVGLGAPCSEVGWTRSIEEVRREEGQAQKQNIYARSAGASAGLAVFPAVAG